MTSHGFIADDKKAIDIYKDQHKHEWAATLGSEDFQITIEADVEEEQGAPTDIIE